MSDQLATKYRREWLAVPVPLFSCWKDHVGRNPETSIIFLDFEVSFGTHIFLDLMEARIYPLALYLDDRQVDCNQNLFYQAFNRRHDWLSGGEALTGCMRLIKVDDSPSGTSRCLVMEDNADKAVAFIRKID
jgi:hypothetical protein